jgi:hypothetical protein
MAGISHIDTCPACNGSGASLRPLGMGVRTVSVLDMLVEARDLPDPSSITIYGVIDGYDLLSVTLQFPAAEPSERAIVAWALRFGGVVVANTMDGDDGPQLWVKTEFTWQDAKVDAFAHIPLPQTEAIRHIGKPHAPGTRHSCEACMAACYCGPDGYTPDGQPCVQCVGESPF